MINQIKTKKSLLRFFRPKNYLFKAKWIFKVFQVKRYSKLTVSQLDEVNQRGLFIDCGSNVGQGFRFFSKFYTMEKFDFILFEPNPNCFRALRENLHDFKNENIEFREQAVGISESTVDFYGLEESKGGQYSVGGTVLPEHNSKYFGRPSKSNLQVHSISFSKLLVEMSEKYEIIVIKLDIEGGEYAILKDLRDNNLFDLIDTLFVEFHSQYMSEPESEIYSKIEGSFWKFIKSTRCRAISWI